MPLQTAPPSDPSTAPQHNNTGIPPLAHSAYMALALSLAHESPPFPTNFRVGAILLHEPSNTILSTGYTLELPGNTHAEQCCLLKYAAEKAVPEEKVGEVLPEGCVVYTTVEPCVRRLSGNVACVERIGGTRRWVQGKEGEGRWEGGIGRVYVGVKEPETFVGVNEGMKVLEGKGVEVVLVPGMEEGILRVATAGHVKEGEEGV